MNMILHGIESPNIIHTNTLEENILEIQDSQRVDVVLANPPFGVKLKKDRFKRIFQLKQVKLRIYFSTFY